MYWKASLCNKKIITVSEFSKGRICKILNVRPENVSVVYNGISEKFNELELSIYEKECVAKKYNLPNRYVLCLSTLEPRKNLRLLLDAYASLFEDGLTEEIVLAGRKGWKMEDFLKGYSKDFIKHVHFTGFVDEEDLPAIYKLAKLLVFPSLYEGFGIPPLEALACGTPVISSDAASMPEILGKHVVYFKNNDVNELKQAIKDIDFESLKIQEVVAPANKYNWRKEAKKINTILNNKNIH